jgi:hypothetical protein
VLPRPGVRVASCCLCLDPGDAPDLRWAQQCAEHRAVDRRQAALLELDPGARGELDRAGEVGLVTDQEDGVEAGRELVRIKVPARKRLGLLVGDPQLLAGDTGCVGGSDLGARQAAINLDPELGQSPSGGQRLAFALAGQPPGGVVAGGVLGVSVSQQPDDLPILPACGNRRANRPMSSGALAMIGQ